MEKIKLNIQLFANTACTVSVKSITQDIANNSSTITIHGKLTTSGSTFNHEGSAYMQPVISNQPVVGSQTSSQTLTKKKFSINTSSSKEYDWEFTVYHNSDGSCPTLTIKINWYATSNTNGTVTLSGGYTPATIPRASDITATDGTLNVTDDVSITITRKNSNFTHTLRYVCGSASGWIKNADNKVGTSATWTPPLSLANQNQSGDTVSCRIYCQTYNGSTTIGSETYKDITLTIPTLNPTASFSSATDDNSYYNTYGVFLQNKSKITFTLSGTAQYSTINTYSWEVRQNNATGTLLASDSKSTVSYIPTVSGTIYFKGTVTDKRGASATTTKTLSITAYKKPTCSLAVSRTSSTAASYTITGSGSPISVSGKTANVVNYVLKRDSTSIYSSSGASLNHSGTDTIADQSYTYTLIAGDTISGTTDTKVVTISTTFTLMNFNSTGYAMAIGKASEATGTNKLLEIALPTTYTEPVNINKSGTGDALIRVKRVDADKAVELVVSGNNRGIYDSTQKKWLLKNDGTNLSFGSLTEAVLKNLIGGSYANADANTFTNTGVYYLTTGATNTPNNLQWCYLLVLRSPAGSDMAQLAIRIGSQYIYYRTRNNSTWSSWQQIKALDISDSYETNVYKARPSSNISVTEVGNQKITLATKDFQSGTNLSLSNGGIKIGKGITKVKVSGQVYYSAGTNAGDSLRCLIYKNSSVVAMNYARAGTNGTYECRSIIPTPISVAENDIIYLYYNNASSGRGTISSSSSDTYLVVEEIS